MAPTCSPADSLGLAANDNFDGDADTAVRRFQASHGAAIDGVVGMMTLRSLDSRHDPHRARLRRSVDQASLR
jgi:murein L,D-transpeptidase YcbB/YkuD